MQTARPNQQATGSFGWSGRGQARFRMADRHTARLGVGIVADVDLVRAPALLAVYGAIKWVHDWVKTWLQPASALGHGIPGW